MNDNNNALKPRLACIIHKVLPAYYISASFQDGTFHFQLVKLDILKKSVIKIKSNLKYNIIFLIK